MPIHRGTRRRSHRSIGRVFQALSDPTRCRVVERLARGPASVSELAKPFDMALPSFLEHLRTLEESGLAQSSKKGRVRTYRLLPSRLSYVQDWLAQQRAEWEQRLDQLETYLDDNTEQQADD